MLRELLEKNRSYRGYDESRKVTYQELKELVELTRLCPASVNIQPLKYYLAWEEEIVANIQKNTKWAGALPELHLPLEGKCPTAFIIICQDTRIDSNTARFLKDVGIVAQTMLLGAVEKGLGGCMIGSYNRMGIIQAAELPEEIVPLLVVAFGKPDEEIILEDAQDRVVYYRDERGAHHVPKRRLEDLIL